MTITTRIIIKIMSVIAIRNSTPMMTIQTIILTKKMLMI